MSRLTYDEWETIGGALICLAENVGREEREDQIVPLIVKWNDMRPAHEGSDQ